MPTATESSDWDECPAVERDPGRLGGALVFKGTRIPVSALFENLKSGATVDEFLEWFPGAERGQVEAVMDHVARPMRSPTVQRLGL